MPKKTLNKLKKIKTLVIILEFLFVFLVIYLVFLPFYPELKYQFSSLKKVDGSEVKLVLEQIEVVKGALPVSEYSVSPDRVIIPKIGVNIPVILTDNEDYGLSLGAWMMPIGSTPDQGGNTIITGHRFKYLPPSNFTFYLFHKLEVGDIFSVIWQGDDYLYKIREIKIVDASDPSPHKPSKEPILTMYTCHPIYSTEKRLVVISDLITEAD